METNERIQTYISFEWQNYVFMFSYLQKKIWKESIVIFKYFFLHLFNDGKNSHCWTLISGKEKVKGKKFCEIKRCDNDNTGV